MAGEKVEVVFDVNTAQFMRGVDAANAKVDSFGDRAKKGFEKFDLGASAVKRSLGSMGDALGANNIKAIKLLDSMADMGDMMSRGALFGGIGVAIFGFSQLNKYMEETEKKINDLLAVADRAAARAQASGAALTDAKTKAGVDAARAQMESQYQIAKARGDELAAMSIKRSMNELDASVRIASVNKEIDDRRAAMLPEQNKLYAEAKDKTQASAIIATELRSIETERKNKIAEIGVELEANNRRLSIELATEKEIARTRKQAESKSSSKSAVKPSQSLDEASAFASGFLATMNARADSEIMDLAERDRQLRLDVEQFRIDSETRALRASINAAKQTANAWKSSFSQIGEASAHAFLDVGVGSLQTFFNASAQGNEDAAQMAAAQFMSQAGSALVSIGTQSLWSGGAKLFGPMAPIGAAEMAFGGAAVAAGLGMGAAGAAIAPKPSTGGSASGGRAGSDRGINSRDRGRRDNGGSGGVSIVINNGLGVTRERQSKELRELIAFSSRRAS